MAASFGRMKPIAWRHFLTEINQKEKGEKKIFYQNEEVLVWKKQSIDKTFMVLLLAFKIHNFKKLK